MELGKRLPVLRKGGKARVVGPEACEHQIGKRFSVLTQDVMKDKENLVLWSRKWETRLKASKTGLTQAVRPYLVQGRG